MHNHYVQKTFTGCEVIFMYGGVKSQLQKAHKLWGGVHNIHIIIIMCTVHPPRPTHVADKTILNPHQLFNPLSLFHLSPAVRLSVSVIQ